MEDDAGWKTGVRIFALCCFVAAFLLTRAVVARRMKVDKTIQVLEVRAPSKYLCNQLTASLSAARHQHHHRPPSLGPPLPSPLILLDHPLPPFSLHYCRPPFAR